MGGPNRALPCVRISSVAPVIFFTLIPLQLQHRLQLPLHVNRHTKTWGLDECPNLASGKGGGREQEVRGFGAEVCAASGRFERTVVVCRRGERRREDFQQLFKPMQGASGAVTVRGGHQRPLLEEAIKSMRGMARSDVACLSAIPSVRPELMKHSVDA